MRLSKWASSWPLRRLALVRLLGQVPIVIHGRLAGDLASARASVRRSQARIKSDGVSAKRRHASWFTRAGWSVADRRTAIRSDLGRSDRTTLWIPLRAQ